VMSSCLLGLVAILAEFDAHVPPEIPHNLQILSQNKQDGEGVLNDTSVLVDCGFPAQNIR